MLTQIRNHQAVKWISGLLLAGIILSFPGSFLMMATSDITTEDLAGASGNFAGESLARVKNPNHQNPDTQKQYLPKPDLPKSDSPNPDSTNPDSPNPDSTNQNSNSGEKVPMVVQTTPGPVQSKQVPVEPSNGPVVSGGAWVSKTPYRQPTPAPQNRPAANRPVSYRNGPSEADLYLVARVIHAEARGEPLKGQVAVGAVLLNRLRDSRFPKTMAGIVFKRGEFCTVRDGQIWMTPSSRAILAARLAAAGWDPTGGAVYFYNPAKTTSRWIWSRPIVNRIGNHIFAV